MMLKNIENEKIRIEAKKILKKYGAKKIKNIYSDNLVEFELMPKYKNLFELQDVSNKEYEILKKLTTIEFLKFELY